MMKPYRVLQVVPAMNAGGLETFIMNVYRNIDRSQLQFDFLYHYDMPCFYDDEILSLGGNITKLTIRQDNDLIRYLRELDSFFKAHPYKILHGHYSGFGMFYNTAAKRNGVPVRIGHSHNTSYEKNLVGTLDKLMSKAFPYGLTHCFACGEDAGRALYGSRPFRIFPNGIDASRFAFSASDRAAIREEFAIPENATVFGHVGRFNQQKNHPYLIDIFRNILKDIPSAYLLLLGDGPEKANIQKLSSDLGAHVIFAGVRSDTYRFYSAMDAFLLPSLFEGLPVVLIEAQASGLPCFVSETVDKTSDLKTGMYFLPLGKPAAWTECIRKTALLRNSDAFHAVQNAGYDIKKTAGELSEFYMNIFEEH